MCYYKLLSFNFFFCPVFLLYFGLPETGTGIGSGIIPPAPVRVGEGEAPPSWDPVPTPKALQ